MHQYQLGSRVLINSCYVHGRQCWVVIYQKVDHPRSWEQYNSNNIGARQITHIPPCCPIDGAITLLVKAKLWIMHLDASILVCMIIKYDHDVGIECVDQITNFMHKLRPSSSSSILHNHSYVVKAVSKPPDVCLNLISITGPFVDRSGASLVQNENTCSWSWANLSRCCPMWRKSPWWLRGCRKMLGIV